MRTSLPATNIAVSW